MGRRTTARRYIGPMLGLVALCASCTPPTGPALTPSARRLLEVWGERPPLDTIGNALAAGDTAWAMALLAASAQAAPAFDSRTLTDLLLLQWIGHSRGHEDALDTWKALERKARRLERRSEAAVVFRAAVGVEHDRGAALGDTVGWAEWRGRVEALGPRLADDDPLLAAAVRWVLVLEDIRRIQRLASTLVPTLEALPLACRTGGVTLACAVRAAGPPGAQLLGLLLQRDSTRTLATLRTDLDRARAGPWPFDEVSARLRVGVAAMTGDLPALAALAGDTAGLTPRSAATVRVIAFAFGGRRARAAGEMAAHPEWYAPLDTALAVLGGSQLAPALFWRLAWPLYLVPYNARQVAHRARLLLADVLQHGVADNAGVFDRYGNRAALIQRGVPLGLALVQAGATGTGMRPVLVSYLSPMMHETIVRTTAGAAPQSLDLALAARNDVAARVPSGYVAEDYDRLTPFEHQVVQYVRDGHRMVDIHAERPTAPQCHDPHPEVGFFLLDSRLDMLREVTDTAPRRRRYNFSMVLAPGTYVYSLELLDVPCHLAARARYLLVVSPPDSSALSDLVLAENAFIEEPARVRGDPPVVVHPGLRVTPAEPLHFYWELYGLTAAETESDRLAVRFEVVNVSAARVRAGQLGSLEQAAERTKPVFDVRYQAPVPGGSGPVGMALSVTLPPEARGVYLARLTVRDRRTGREETAQRALYVEPGGG
jgi:hypothetical protein